MCGGHLVRFGGSELLGVDDVYRRPIRDQHAERHREPHLLGMRRGYVLDDDQRRELYGMVDLRGRNLREQHAGRLHGSRLYALCCRHDLDDDQRR